MGLSSADSYRTPFKHLRIFPLQSQYILSLLIFVVENKNLFHVKSEIHSFNPLPLLFIALLQGWKDCVFFSGHLIHILQQERFRAFRPAGGV
jgi:hypothetical protein